MIERNEKTVELFGHKFLMTERPAAYVLNLMDWHAATSDSAQKAQFFYAQAISDSFVEQRRVSIVKFFQWLRMRFIGHKTKPKYLLRHLTTKQLEDLFWCVSELEGIERPEPGASPSPSEKKKSLEESTHKD